MTSEPQSPQPRPGAGDRRRIMIVDDEPNVLASLRRLLLLVPCTYGRLRYKLEVETFASPQAGLQRAREQPFDAFLSDYRMPEMSGIEFLHAVKEIQPDAARLIISGFADLNAFADAVNGADIYRFLSKPWNDYVLVSAIAQALNYRDLVLENRWLAEHARIENPIAASRPAGAEAAPGVRWGDDGSAIVDGGPRDDD